MQELYAVFVEEWPIKSYDSCPAIVWPVAVCDPLKYTKHEAKIDINEMLALESGHCMCYLVPYSLCFCA